ncbi:MAG TPA: DUF1330 domain-containing protein [Niastella sp.]
MERITELNAAIVSATEQSFPADTPVYMVNLLRYKAYADYNNAAGASPCSGRDVYFQRYAGWFRKIAADKGVKVLFLGSVSAGIAVPEGEQWDDIVIVEYPSFDTFRRIVESEEYLADAAPHRKAALEDWRLIATNRIEL